MPCYPVRIENFFPLGNGRNEKRGKSISPIVRKNNFYSNVAVLC